MPVTASQKHALQEVLHALTSTVGVPRKRQIAEEFLELVDREDWPQYYEVIPEPRCLNSIQASIEKNRYKDAMDAYTDMSLVFWNALYYNEETSQIAIDANTLKGILQNEWKKRPVLPPPRNSPPPSAPQKVHNVVKAEPAPAQAHSPAKVQSNPPLSRTQTKTLRPRAAKQYTSAAQVDSDLDMDSDDVDIDGSTPEPDVPVVHASTSKAADEEPERDTESEQIVSALEKGLPLWPGFGDDGWIDDERVFTAEKIIDIVHLIKTHKDVIGNRFALALESVPEDMSSVPYAASPKAISLKIIENRARSKSYTSPKEFDLDMAHLFLKARRYHELTSEAYGKVLLLQRFYQALTSPTPPSGPPYISKTHFAALPIGPGNAKPLIETGTTPPSTILPSSSANTVAGVTSYRIPTRERTFVDEVTYKGWTVKCADWVHLSNADDPSRPVVAQVWKCWVSEEPSKKGEFGMTVCWYYRPEQTFHTADKRFWQGEVFKTSHFADHPLPDLLEKITVQFTARHIRGRARPPYYYPTFPLYVCDQRYNDRERLFVKIKNWNSCVPEEVRKSESFMPIYLFERTIWPKAEGTPFTKANNGVKWPGGLIEGRSALDPVDGNGKKKALRAGDTRAQSVAAASGSGVVPPVGYPSYAYQQQLMNGVNATYGRIPLVVQQDRSIIGAAGVLAGGAHLEKLPSETGKYFDRDSETNELLWFSAPPVVNMACNPEPAYSLRYLDYLAAKRKREEQGEEKDPEEDVKRRKFTVMEAMSALLVGVVKESN